MFSPFVYCLHSLGSCRRRLSLLPPDIRRVVLAGDRPTLFLEIIQRVGCERDVGAGKKEQAGGCGGFGKGNFHALFKSIEEHEKTLKV